MGASPQRSTRLSRPRNSHTWAHSPRNCNRVDDPLPAGSNGRDIPSRPLMRSPHFPSSTPWPISIGPFAIRWYALAYVAGLLGGWFYAKRLAAKAGSLGLRCASPRPPDVDDLIVWVALGVVLGGRMGYVLFYNLSSYLRGPLEVLAVWHGGMSFHGGFLGACVAIVLFARWRGSTALADARHGGGGDADRPVLRAHRQFHQRRALGPPRPRLSLCDRLSACGPMPRHPSQLYEAFGEGLVLFVVMAIAARTLRLPPARPPRRHLRAGLRGRPHRLRVLPRARRAARLPVRLLGRGLGGGITMGMLLSVPMALVGAGVIVMAARGYTRPARPVEAA